MIRILTIHHTTPDISSYTTILFRNVLKILRERREVHMIWVIHSVEKIDVMNYEDQNTSVIYITDYKDAVEILKKMKPDLVYGLPGFSVIDYAFLIAAKQLKIKTLGGELGNFLFIKKSKGIIPKILNVLQINTKKNLRKSLLKGKFFIYKHIFLVKTYFSLNWNISKIIKNIFKIIKVYIPPGITYPNFVDFDLVFVESQKTINTLKKYGYEESKIRITGNPTYDQVFQTLRKYENRSNQKNIRILILTMTVIGDTQKAIMKQRETFVKGVITQIKQHFKEITITVKIHPTNEDCSEYRKIIDSIDPKIKIYQKGDLVEYLKNTDVLITPATSTGVILALISKIPIIIWNVFEVEEDVLLKNEFAIECKQEEEVVQCVKNALSFNPPLEKVNSFINEYFFKSDGKASERIADIMIELIEKG